MARKNNQFFYGVQLMVEDAPEALFVRVPGAAKNYHGDASLSLAPTQGQIVGATSAQIHDFLMFCVEGGLVVRVYTGMHSSKELVCNQVEYQYAEIPHDDIRRMLSGRNDCVPFSMGGIVVYTAWTHAQERECGILDVQYSLQGGGNTRWEDWGAAGAPKAKEICGLIGRVVSTETEVAGLEAENARLQTLAEALTEAVETAIGHLEATRRWIRDERIARIRRGLEKALG